VRTRIEAGAAVAGLFLALGALALGQRWGAGYAFAFFVLAALAILGAFANRVPILHRLPLVGAPRLHAVLTIDGRSGDKITMPGDGANRYFLVCLGIRNSRRIDVQPAHVNFLLSEGLNPLKCDHLGKADEDGRWMRPTKEMIGDDDPNPYKDYYAESRAFPGDNSVVWWFRVMLRSHGRYRFRLKVNSPVLYNEYVEDFEIHAEPRGPEPSVVDQLDDLIDKGEALVTVESAFFEEPALRQRVGAYVVEGNNALPDSFRQGFNDANSRRWDGRDVEERLVGKPYLEGVAKAKLAYLYEARRRIGDEVDSGG
jgi:hypothetical protein